MLPALDHLFARPVHRGFPSRARGRSELVPIFYVRAALVASCTLVACVGSANGGHVHGLGVQTATQPTLSPIEFSVSQLADATLPDRARYNAALVLLRNTADPAALEAIDAGLTAPLSGVGGGRYILAALLDENSWSPGQLSASQGAVPPAGTGVLWPPEVLLGPLAARVASADREETPKLLAALSRYPSRFAAGVLLSKTTGDADEATAFAAFAALRALSGRDDLPDDTVVWRAWLASYDNVNEAQWQRVLATNLARTARVRTADAERYVDLLVTAQRKLYLATRADERPALLLELLMQKEPVVPALRALGFELCQRELSNSGTLDERLGDAALTLLSDPSPAVRSPAAVLARQLTPRGSAEAIVSALHRETDPQAASDLLLAAARTPTPDAVTAVMNWVLRDSDARPAAIEAVLRITRVIDLSDQDRTALLTLLRTSLDSLLDSPALSRPQPGTGLSPTDISGAGVELLATQGDDSDRARLAQLLGDDYALVLRTAAADALVWYPEYTQAILTSARTHPEVFPMAIKAVTVQSPTAAQLRELLILTPVGSESTRPELAALVRVMNADEILPALEGLRDPSLRTLLLTSLASPARYLAESARPTSSDAICKGTILLADESLARGDAALALSTLDSSPHAEIAPVTAEVAHELRLAALLALGRVDDARRVVAGRAELERNITPWLRGAELALTTPAAASTAAYVDAVVGPALTPAQRARLQAAVAREFLIGPPAPAAQSRE